MSISSTPNRQQVIDYLRRHPDFFMTEDDLLAGLSLPHPSGKAVSLLERQVAVLRDRGQDARHKLHSLLVNARTNDQLFETTSKLVLALLRAEGLVSIISTAQEQLLAQPNIDACEIILCDTLIKSVSKPAPVLRSLSAHRLKADYAEVFRLNHTHCGPLDRKRIDYLFPANPDTLDVRSTALCPLCVSGNPALIALGNTESDYFNIHLDTLFLDFIGRLLSTLLEKSAKAKQP